MNSYRFLVIGAHPDDCDLMAAGLAMKMLAKGHEVFFLSATDGSAGHQTMSREDLAARRAGECKKAGEILGLTYEALPIPDGELTADLPYRRMLMKRIREIAPDVIITHRTCDYHPDHRACGQLVMDCSYLVGVPLFCPEVPALRKAPVILSMWDHFTNPTPFRADVCVPIGEVWNARSTQRFPMFRSSTNGCPGLADGRLLKTRPPLKPKQSCSVSRCTIVFPVQQSSIPTNCRKARNMPRRLSGTSTAAR